jgi:hypothetical protein
VSSSHSSGGGGASAPVTLTALAADVVPLRLVGAASQSSSFLEIVNSAGQTVLTVSAPGGSGLSYQPNAGADNAAFVVEDDGDFYHRLANGDIYLDTRGGMLQIDPVGGVNVRASGYMVIAYIGGAPADGQLWNGSAAFWFDRTNGASKMMVKAKSQDGTVVSGSINLA